MSDLTTLQCIYIMHIHNESRRKEFIFLWFVFQICKWNHVCHKKYSQYIFNLSAKEFVFQVRPRAFWDYIRIIIVLQRSSSVFNHWLMFDELLESSYYVLQYKCKSVEVWVCKFHSVNDSLVIWPVVSSLDSCRSVTLRWKYIFEWLLNIILINLDYIYMMIGTAGVTVNLSRT